MQEKKELEQIAINTIGKKELKKVLEVKPVIYVQSASIVRKEGLTYFKDKLELSSLIMETVEHRDIAIGKNILVTPSKKGFVTNIIDNSVDDIFVLSSDLSDRFNKLYSNRISYISERGFIVRLWPNKTKEPMLLMLSGGVFIPIQSKYDKKQGTFVSEISFTYGEIREWVAKGCADIFLFYERAVSGTRKHQSMFLKMKREENFLLFQEDYNRIMSDSTAGAWDKYIVEQLLGPKPFKKGFKTFERRSIPLTSSVVYKNAVKSFVIYAGEFKVGGVAHSDGHLFNNTMLIVNIVKELLGDEEFRKASQIEKLHMVQERIGTIKGEASLLCPEDMKTLIESAIKLLNAEIVYMTREEYNLSPVDLNAPENRGKFFCIGTRNLEEVDVFVDETCLKTPMDFGQDMDLNLMAFPPNDKYLVSLSNQILISILPRGKYTDEEGRTVTGKELYCDIFRENIDKMVDRLFTEKTSLAYKDIMNIKGYSADLVKAISYIAYIRDRRFRRKATGNLIDSLNKMINGFNAEVEGFHAVGDCCPLLLILGESLLEKNEMYSGNVKEGKRLTAIFRHPKAGESEFSLLYDLSYDIILEKIARLFEEGRINEAQKRLLERYYRNVRGRCAIFPTHDPDFVRRHGGSDSDGDAYTCITDPRIVQCLEDIPKQAIEYGSFDAKGRYVMLADYWETTKKVMHTVEEVEAFLKERKVKSLSDEQLEGILAKAKDIFNGNPNATIETLNNAISMSNFTNSGNLDVGMGVVLMLAYVGVFGSILNGSLNDDNFEEFCRTVWGYDKTTGRFRDGLTPEESPLIMFNCPEKYRGSRTPYTERVFSGDSVIITGEPDEDEKGIQSVRTWYNMCQGKYVENVEQLTLFIQDLISVMSSVIGRIIDAAKSGEPVFCPFTEFGSAIRSCYAKGKVGCNAVALTWDKETDKVDIIKATPGPFQPINEKGEESGPPLWVCGDDSLILKNETVEIAKEAMDKIIDTMDKIRQAGDSVTLVSSPVALSELSILAKNYSFFNASNADMIKEMKPYYAATARAMVWADMCFRKMKPENVSRFGKEVLALARHASVKDNGGDDSAFYTIFGPELALEAMDYRQSPMPLVSTKVYTVNDYIFKTGDELSFKDGVGDVDGVRVYAEDKITGDFVVDCRNGKPYVDIDVEDFLQEQILESASSRQFALPIGATVTTSIEEDSGKIVRVCLDYAEQIAYYNTFARDGGAFEYVALANTTHGNLIVAVNRKKKVVNPVCSLYMPGRQVNDYTKDCGIASFLIDRKKISLVRGVVTEGESTTFGAVSFEVIEDADDKLLELIDENIRR